MLARSLPRSVTPWQCAPPLEVCSNQQVYTQASSQPVNPPSHNDDAASAAPAAWKAPLLVHRISTLCIHSMYLAQPTGQTRVSMYSYRNLYHAKNLLQYANFRPRNLPAKGMIIMVSRSCSCSRLASHSRCASDKSVSESESRMLLEMEGSESISSSRSEEERDTSGIMKEEDADGLVMPDEDVLAIAQASLGKGGRRREWRCGDRRGRLSRPGQGTKGRDCHGLVRHWLLAELGAAEDSDRSSSG